MTDDTTPVEARDADEGTAPTVRRRPVVDGTPVHEIDDARFRQLSRRAVLTGGVVAAAGFAGFRSISNMEEDGRSPWLLRRSYEFNEALWRNLHDPDQLAPEFPFARSGMPIVNGRRGLEEDVELDGYTITVSDADAGELAVLTMDDVRALPFTESIFEFKCVEGWSQVTAFGGTRFSDFIDTLFPEQADRQWVAMNTPSGGYPVSFDRQAMRHPQSLLAWEMQREPLTQGHGAPLRLATPLKYGLKNIRRIASIEFTDTEPEDFWGERGYSRWVGL